MDYQKAKKILLLLIVLLVAVVLVYVLTADKVGDKTTKSDVVVKKTNITAAQSDQEKLPPGFPGNIPVETSQVTESSSASYKNPDVTLYTLSFLSNQTIEEKAGVYRDFLKNAEYGFEETGDNGSVKTFIGKKDGDELMISISRATVGIYVQISYTDAP